MKLSISYTEMKSRRKVIFYTLLGCLAVITIILIATRKETQTPERPTVCISPVSQQNVEIYGDYVGRIKAQQFVEVRARVEGFLEQMHFEEGRYVKQGQTLFVINPDQYKAKVDKARAQLKKDKAQANKAQRDLARIRPLHEQNAASQLDLDNAVAAFETAQANVGMSSADLDQAERELSYTIVRSPISGHISESNVDLGTLVGAGNKSLLATIVKSDTILIDFSMTVLDYLKSKERNVSLGNNDSTRWKQTVTITLPDHSIYDHKGIVDFASPQVNPKTGTFQVRAKLANPDHVLLPGQFTKVKVLLDVREKATVVPLKSLIIEKGGAYIYVVRNDSTAEKRFIEIGPEFGNNVLVERGLAPDENIVVEGQHKLSSGLKVRIAEEAFHHPEESVDDRFTASKDSL